ncbi:MAG: hypothetical protein WC807_00040 [Hyphomicrobium sp.]|jgi:hypothetical protein
MIRVFIENLILFLLPALVYVAWVMMTRPSSDDDKETMSGAWKVIDDAPLLWLFGAGATLILLTLIAFGTSNSGGKPGQVYHPSTMKDGKIE